MRIGYLSSYPPIECGIATYTAYLESAVHDREIETFVVAPNGAKGDRVFPTYQSGSGEFAPAVFQMLTQLTPDVVHIQHEYGLFGPNRGMEIVDLVLRLRMIRVPVVITLHTVYESLSPEEHLVLRHLLAECSGIIVHEDFQRQTLRSELGNKIADKVEVIDHGIREVAAVDDAKAKLDLEDSKVVMLCGYFRPTKGFHKALDFFGEVAEEHPDALLVLAGKTRNIEYDDYRRQLLAEIEAAPFASQVRVLSGQFPQHTFDTLLSAADVVVLPYDVGAQSGVLSQAIAFKRPIVTSKLRAFQSVTARSGAGVSCDDDSYGKEINRILGDGDVARSLATSADRYIRRRGGWSVVASRHEDLYRQCLEERGNNGQDVYVPGETEQAQPTAPVLEAVTSTVEDLAADAPSTNYNMVSEFVAPVS